MIPVAQRTRFDCLTACLASIFECRYEDVPVFCDQETGESAPLWHVALDGWLADRGFAFLQRVREEGMDDDPMFCPWAYPGYWIVGVKSPRVDGEHAVVMCGRELVWDPHPEREQGHRGFLSADHFVPLDPARLRLDRPSVAPAGEPKIGAVT